MNTLDSIIRSRRMTLRQVAEITGYDFASVSKHRRKKQLTAEAALRYARALGVNPEVFRPDLFPAQPDAPAPPAAPSREVRP